MSNQMLAFEARKKSTGTAYLLWFFLGVLGMHRFYAGKTKTAVAQLVLGVGGLFTAIFSTMAGVGANMAGNMAGGENAGGVAGFAFLVWGIVALWILVDVFFVGRWINRHNMTLAEELSGGTTTA